MTIIELPEIAVNDKFLKRNAKSLAKNFKPLNGTQLNKAAIFAVYLVAVERIDDAIILLESFVNDIESVDVQRDIWGSVGEGIILLAYLYNKNEEYELATNLVKKIVADDIMSDTCSRAEYFAEDLAEHNELMGYAASETQKYNCEIIAQQILKFSYYSVMWSYFEHEVHSSEKNILDKLIQNIYEELRKSILE